MKLTERQCWDVIRSMVSEKNKEYAGFVNGVVRDEALSRCIGYVKRCYLNKFGFATEGDFRYLLKNRKITPKREWIDNLSSEDLLLFLDYQCRTMQDMYDYYKQNRTSIERNRDGDIMFERDVKNILAKTRRSALIEYNSNRLKATARPEKQQGEVKIDKLDLTRDELIEQALIQVMANMAYKYCKFTLTDIEKAVGYLTRIKTHNVNIKGFATGKINRIKPESVLEYLKQNYDLNKLNEYLAEARKGNVKPEYNNKGGLEEPKIEMVGFDENKSPVYMIGDKFVDFMSIEIPPVHVVYDRNKNLIKYEEVEDDETMVHKFVGLDVQGTPVFEDEDGYYLSTGERIDEDDLVLDNTQDDMFAR